MNGDEFERLLNHGLATYALAEPRAGLERRILARVHRRSLWPRYAAMAALAAGLAVLLVPRPERPLTTPAPTPVLVLREAPPQQAKLPGAPPRSRLTPEEGALVAFAQQAPDVARQLAEPDKPLEIKAINIPPIQIDGIEIGEIQ